jgi:hypothetical protein
MRVCQFRHDGNLNYNAAAAPRPPCQEDQLFHFCSPLPACQTPTRLPKPENRSPAYPNLAVMEIFAFSTFDTGQPFSAASAYF